MSSFSWQKLREMLAYSWPMIPNSLSFWVMNLSDRWIVTFVLGIEANAVYVVANKIPNLLAILQTTFTFAWQENASMAVKDKDAGAYYSEMFDDFFTVLAGAMAGLLAFTPLLFKILINEQYAAAYPQMSFLFLGMVFATLSSFLGGIYTAHKKTKSVGITTLLAAICNIIINVAFIRVIGLYAASLSTLFSYLFLTLYRMWDVQKFEKITYKWPKIIGNLIILAGMGILCSRNVLGLNIFNFIFGMVYAAVLCRKIIFALLERVKNRLHRKK